MAIAYTWEITGLKKTSTGTYDQDHIVVQVYWNCVGTDEQGVSGVFPGATPFDPSAVDPDNFTTYENLTQDQVIGWVQDVVNNNEQYRNHIETQILQQIIQKTVSPVDVDANNMPWAV